METSSKHGRIIPTNFGLKYNPPKLGVQYYFKNNPKATFVHEVTIENVEENTKDDLINDLFSKHQKFIDPKVVSRNQLENLMDRLKSNVSKNSLKENTAPNLKELETHSKPAINDAKLPGEPDFDSKPHFDDFGDRHDEEDHKNVDKDLMLDDFDLGNEDQKVDALFNKPNNDKHNENNDLLGGLADDFTSGNDKPMEHDDHDKPTSNAEEGDDDEDSDAIDIDNEEELAARGLKKIQIEGEEEEFLMDNEGNIYNLNGDFIGTTNGDADEEDDGDNF